MYQEDQFNPVEQNDYDNDVEKMFEQAKRSDRGYNVVYRRDQKNNGVWYNKKIEVYTTSGIGNHIRDAESGHYYPNIVGSMDEDLFFKVILATGECKSANGSSTLFYSSPQHYANHLLCELSPEIISAWEQKRNTRLAQLKFDNRQKFESVEVK